jgi:hypothetical protein
MGNRGKSIGSVLMLTNVLGSFVVVFTVSMTGGVVRLGIASLQAAVACRAIARMYMLPFTGFSPFQCLWNTDIVMR